MDTNTAPTNPRVLLVTGGCGFIGSNFINCYHKAYPMVKIVNVDRLDYCATEDNLDSPHPSWYSFYACDITNADTLKYILRRHKPDAVVHFAAQSHVDNSFGNSLSFTRDNVVGTHTLLECCRTELGETLKRFVHISTDEVYGEVAADHPGCTEQSLLNPTNPYAASKAAAEFFVRSYNHSYGLPTIITRGNNVYGPRQYPEKVIPRFINQVLRGERMTVQGEGLSTRNFIHVYDVAEAVATILHKGAVGHIYNIGGDCELPVLEVARRILGLIRPADVGDLMSPEFIVATKSPLNNSGSSSSLENCDISKISRSQKRTGDLNDCRNFKDWMSSWIEWVPDRLFNDQRYAVKNDALVALGWRPTIDFADGLRMTIQWYTHKFLTKPA